MKTITLTVITILSALGIAASKIWAIVSFIIYIAKDQPFDWRSIWLFVICLVALIVSYMALRMDSTREFKTSRKSPSNFQKKLEEMEKQRK